MIFQIFLVAFALFAIIKTVRQYKDQRVSTYWFGVWGLLWLLVILVALWPQTADRLAAVVGVGRGSDALVYTAVVILAYLEYRSMIRQERLHKEITELTRSIAIKTARPPGCCGRGPERSLHE